MSRADDQKRYRDRGKRGEGASWADYDGDVFSSLLYAGLLDEKTAHERKRLRAALSAALRDWARKTNPFL